MSVNGRLGNYIDPESSVFTVFNIVLVLFACLAAAAVIRCLYVRNKNKRVPRRTEEAAVIGKTTEKTIWRHDPTDVTGLRNSHYIRYYIVFRTKDSGQVTLKVSAGEFNRVQEGQAGTLTFQGSHYLGFEERA